ncbi:MAG: sigma factor [Ignavibacteriaceae bacterium]
MTEQAKTVEQTFFKEKSRLFNFIRKFVPSREDAEDILQDVFYQFISYADIELIERVNGMIGFLRNWIARKLLQLETFFLE